MVGIGSGARDGSPILRGGRSTRSCPGARGTALAAKGEMTCTSERGFCNRDQETVFMSTDLLLEQCNWFDFGSAVAWVDGAITD